MHIRNASALHWGNSQAIRLLAGFSALAIIALAIIAVVLAGLCVAGLAGAVEPASVQAAGWSGLAALAAAACLAIAAAAAIDGLRAAFAERLRSPAPLAAPATLHHVPAGACLIVPSPPPRESLC